MSAWFKFWKKSQGSAQIAKDRLQIIVARERSSSSEKPGYLPKLQQELLQVIAKYEKVDLDRVNVSIDKRGDADVLELTILLPDGEEPAEKLRSRVAFA